MRRNRKKRQIDKFERHQLIHFIADAITASGGTVYFKEPFVIWADDMFGQVPISVRKLISERHLNDKYEGFSVTEDYSDLHLDILTIREIAHKLAVQ